jgi:hypothetical protein
MESDYGKRQGAGNPGKQGTKDYRFSSLLYSSSKNTRGMEDFGKPSHGGIKTGGPLLFRCGVIHSPILGKAEWVCLLLLTIFGRLGKEQSGLSRVAR